MGIILILVAFVFRIYSLHHLHYVYLYGDMVHYDHAASMLLAHHVFSYWSTTPDAFVTPGYPLFLAMCYVVAGMFTHAHQGQLLFAVYMQGILSSLTVGLVYLIGRRVMGARWAVLAALIWMFYPPSSWSMVLLLTETLYLFLLLLFIWIFLLAMSNKTPLWWFIAGLVLASTVLVRPTVLPLAIAPVVWLVWKRAHKSFTFRTLVPYFAGFLIPLLPWWVRNMIVLHRFLLTDDDLGNPLLFGTDPNFQHDPGLTQGVTDQKALAIHRIIEGITNHPWATLKWYTVDKLHYLFAHPWFYPAHVSGQEMLLAKMHLIWVCLGALGLFIGFFHSRFRLVSVLALFFVLVQLVFIPVNRYAFPIMSLFIIGVGFLGYRICDRISNRRVSQVVKEKFR